MEKNKSNFTGIRTLTAGSKVHHSTNWAIFAEFERGQKLVFLYKMQDFDKNVQKNILNSIYSKVHR